MIRHDKARDKSRHCTKYSCDSEPGKSRRSTRDVTSQLKIGHVTVQKRSTQSRHRQTLVQPSRLGLRGHVTGSHGRPKTALRRSRSRHRDRLSRSRLTCSIFPCLRSYAMRYSPWS
eukprot:3448291-Rhodomonas_salina.3